MAEENERPLYQRYQFKHLFFQAGIILLLIGMSGQLFQFGALLFLDVKWVVLVGLPAGAVVFLGFVFAVKGGKETSAIKNLLSEAPDASWEMPEEWVKQTHKSKVKKFRDEVTTGIWALAVAVIALMWWTKEKEGIGIFAGVGVGLFVIAGSIYIAVMLSLPKEIRMQERVVLVYGTEVIAGGFLLPLHGFTIKEDSKTPEGWISGTITGKGNGLFSERDILVPEPLMNALLVRDTTRITP